MQFSLETALPILERTPNVLNELLCGLDDAWTTPNEGPDTWSPFDVIGHLIHGERTDWIPRVRMIVEHGESQAFEPFDRFAQFEESRGKSMKTLLNEFAELRDQNLVELQDMDLKPDDFGRRGTHPELGTVTLGQLLSTWVVHDLDHVVQVSRVMAKQYSDQVGPWRAYVRVLGDRVSS
ncbi:MAG: DinB family protein [Rubricoccaceae bacterium]|nr:DinB family protein [Rubricoccaceae bacterium]